MKQRTNEWFKARLGKFTASEIHKLMGAKGFGQTGESYILEKVAEQLTEESKDIPQTKAMEWGQNLEDTAKEYYEIAFKEKIKEEGLVVPDWCKDAGASPDGLLEGKSKGLEIKCPFVSANHVKHLTMKSANNLKANAKEYYWQIIHCLAVTGLERWDFCSFDPRFTGSLRMFCMEVKAVDVADDIALLKQRIIEASERKQEIINQINL